MERIRLAKKWTAIIDSDHKLVDLKLKEVWQYRDLVWLFVKRDFTTKYKQTILGPLWFIIQPLFVTIVQTVVFGNMAGLPTDGIPEFLFYMSGNVAWLYFSACITSTASTFISNARLFGKIYFPRMTSPIASAISSLVNFFIQFIIFIVFLVVFMVRGSDIHITWVAALTPLLMLNLAVLGTGFGIIISSLTTKYRDLQVMVSFGLQLWMYFSPVIVSASSLSPGMYNLMMCNPVSPVIELMRYGWLGSGTTPFFFWGISGAVSIVVLLLGIILFNKVERTFMDTV